MKTTIYHLVYLISLATYGQKVVSGQVIDSLNGKKLQYVNIGIKNMSIGTVTASDGGFELELNELVNNTDTIIFSHIGYKSKSFRVDRLTNENPIQISLLQEVKALDEVVLFNKVPNKIKSKKLGRSGKGIGLMHCNFYSAYEKDVDDRLSKEIGMRFRINKNLKIEGLNFNVTSNQFDKIKFRVNIYRIKDKMPYELLNEKDILFTIEDGFLGWHKVDLSSYELYFDKTIQEIAVTIQWVDSQKRNEKSKFFSISTAKSFSKDFFYREKAMDKWINSKSRLSFYLDAKIE